MTCWYPGIAEQILRGLSAQTRPSLVLFVEGAGHLPDWDIALMQVAYSLEPARLHPALLIECVPSTRPDSFFERMTAAARRGWLYEDRGWFGLTNQGREIVEGVYELGDRLYGKIRALAGSELERLIFLSDCVIDQIKQLSEPARKPSFELSLLFDRGMEMPLIVQVQQRMIILLSFRGDAHVAAWRPYEQNGQLWDAFTLICQEQTDSAAELFEKLSHRNYTKSDYACALQKLAARGWITDNGDKFTPQLQAARMCQEVEKATDHFFAAAFVGLNLAEKREFQELMKKFDAGVTLQENDIN